MVRHARSITECSCNRGSLLHLIYENLNCGRFVNKSHSKQDVLTTRFLQLLD